jgi:hypothetical protein
MPHHASAIPADFYDHEQDAQSGRRRRAAPDWGGDDLFTSTPRRRRFDRPLVDDHDSDASSRLDQVLQPDTMEHVLPVAAAAATATARSVAGDGAPRLSLEIPPALDPGRSVRYGAPVAPNGRRTVTVTGHPERGYGVPSRRRPAPTLDERLIGSRPDRVAMWAFALGVLLIVIAFLSANA